jgi:Cu(I)/Ag(I) efflux system membrane fusion protein
VVLNNKETIFKPGMFVTANIERVSSSNDEVLTIPASAVLWTGERSVVYLKTSQDQPVFEMREVKLGNQIGNEYEVLEGLFAGNEIVTNGTFTVDAAAQLQGKKSMMNKDGGKVMTGHEGHLGMDNNASNKESDHTNMNERLEVSEKFQQQLNSVYNAYINLKDALVKEDSISTSANATTLLNKLNKVDMKLLSDNKAHNHWMSLEGEIKSSATSISETPDIKSQRDHFKHLSSHLINAVQLFGINEKVYVEFCPMADNNNGAYWLSKEEKVINPYFGEAMLTCGEVKQVIE